MKRIILSIFLSVAMVMVMMPSMAFAEEAELPASGTCGENVTWELDSEGVLTISGTGTMDDSFCEEEKELFKKVVISSGITSIDNYMFMDCGNLTDVTIPDSVTDIGDGAFWNCSNLKNISIPDGVTSINYATFACCSSLTDITLPDGVTSIGDEAFSHCRNLTRILIPDGVTSIGTLAFDSCSSLTDIPLPNGVTSISDGVFWGCSNLTNITIPDGVTSVGDEAFKGCSSLTRITVSNSVTSVGERAFYGCSSLSDIAIPDSVNTIGSDAFSQCKNLIIVCNKGSAAYDYAKANNIKIKCMSSHEYGEWIIDKKPTCTESGSRHRECANCAHTTAYEEMSALGHRYNEVITKATLSKDGKVENRCSECGDVYSATVIYRPSGFSLSATTYTYSGDIKTPTVTVKDSAGRTLKKDIDYTLVYATGRKNVGKYAVKINFKGNYSESKALHFTINPPKTSLTSATAEKKGFTAKWSKKSSQVTGYQIQYSTSSKFTNAKTVTVSKYSTTSAKVTKLSAKKKYYVRVRTYKTVNGTNYYSDWSSAKNITTKA